MSYQKSHEMALGIVERLHEELGEIKTRSRTLLETIVVENLNERDPVESLISIRDKAKKLFPKMFTEAMK